jgi:hypothetical protein
LGLDDPVPDGAKPLGMTGQIVGFASAATGLAAAGLFLALTAALLGIIRAVIFFPSIVGGSPV